MIKKLMKSLREFKKEAILSVFFIFLETLIECVIPFIMTYLIDEVSKGDRGATNIKLVAIYSSVLVFISFLALLVGAIAAKYSAVAASGFAKNLRYDVYKKTQEFSFKNIEKFTPASLLTRLSTDITYVRMSFMAIIRTAIRGPFLLIFAVSMSFIISYKMAWVFAVTIPFIFISILIIVLKVLPMFKKVFKNYDKLNQRVEENILGIRMVKSFNQEKYEKEKFEKSNKEQFIDFKKTDMIASLSEPIMQFSTFLLSALLIGIGSIFIIKNSSYNPISKSYSWGFLSPGQFSSLWVYCIQTLISLMMFAMVIVMILISYESARRITEVLDEKIDIKNCDDPIFEIPNSVIEFKNVSFKYDEKGDNFALKDISFKIDEGEFIGIIGATGSSKTTLVSLLGRLYDVSSGEILIGGNNIKKYDLKTLRNFISYVPQKNMLFSGTILENLKFGNDNASEEDIKTALDISCSSEFVSKLDKKEESQVLQQGANFSGGQKQRLCLARAILKKSNILILDDATSAIDSKTDSKIKKDMKDKLSKITKIVIAQRISAVKECKKIIVMDNGMINQIGTHEELLKNNLIYQEVYKSQINEEK